MDMQKFSLRGLQLVSLVSAGVAIHGGGTFVLNGIDGVAPIFSREYLELVPALSAAAAAMDAEALTIGTEC
ncbi:MAG: hypothetical protein ACI9JM_001960 [Halioglobus sp.]|jgi:hypothetical protein